VLNVDIFVTTSQALFLAFIILSSFQVFSQGANPRQCTRAFWNLDNIRSFVQFSLPQLADDGPYSVGFVMKK
jgi:hypothetical protein